MTRRTDHLTIGLIALLFGMVAIFQTTPISTPHILGGRPDLLLVLVLVWGLVRSVEEVMIAAPPAALLAGLLGPGPIGAPLLVLLAPVGLALLVRERQTRRLPALAVSLLLCTLWTFVVTLSADFMSGQHSLHLSGIVGVLLGACLLNLALCLILYWPLLLLRKGQVRRRAGLSLG